jgi:hypothetical protein
MNAHRWFCLLVFAGSQMLRLQASTIVSVTGALVGEAYGIQESPQLSNTAASTWTSSTTYSHVVISALLENTPGTVTGAAYLMTQVGPGTTTTSQVATALFAPPPPYTPVWVTLFSDLTLPAVTYFLVLAAGVPGITALWRDAYPDLPDITTDTGVTRNPDLLSSSNLFLSFPPARVYLPNNGIRGGDLFLQYTVMGTEISEPQGITLCLTGMALVFVWLARAHPGEMDSFVNGRTRSSTSRSITASAVPTPNPVMTSKPRLRPDRAVPGADQTSERLSKPCRQLG